MVFHVHYKVHPVNTGLQGKNVLCNSQWKASKLVSFKNGGTLTLIDSDILNKKDILLPPKKYVLIENKNIYLIWYIFY